MKFCPQCATNKPRAEFYQNKRRSDGVTAQCEVCCRVNAARRRAEKPEVTRLEVRDAFARNRAQYADGARAGKKRWREANTEHQREYFSGYRKRNRPKLTAYRAKARACQKRATPSWASESYIAMFYEMAKLEGQRVGTAVEVDHIVPLQSPLVCGLHCEYNLQLLTRWANRSKANRSWPDMPT